jgi:hypothetical protein
MRIEDLIENLLAASENMLEILPEEDLNLALHNFVEKDEKSAIEEYVPPSALRSLLSALCFPLLYSSLFLPALLSLLSPLSSSLTSFLLDL